jgi:hypothetical protein
MGTSGLFVMVLGDAKIKSGFCYGSSSLPLAVAVVLHQIAASRLSTVTNMNSSQRRMAMGGHGLPIVTLKPPCPTLLRRAPSTVLGVDPLTGQAAFGRLLSFWTPHAARLCMNFCLSHVLLIKPQNA